MTPTGSLRSLQDALDILNQALEAPDGLRLVFEKRGMAVNFRQRLYTARKKDRELDTAGPNMSVYDSLVVGQVHEEADGYSIQIRKSDNPHGIKRIEEL